MTTVSSDRIRIKLKAYEYSILDKAVTEKAGTEWNTRTGLSVAIPLPTTETKYTVYSRLPVAHK